MRRVTIFVPRQTSARRGRERGWWLRGQLRSAGAVSVLALALCPIPAQSHLTVRYRSPVPGERRFYIKSAQIASGIDLFRPQFERTENDRDTQYSSLVLMDHVKR